MSRILVFDDEGSRLASFGEALSRRGHVWTVLPSDHATTEVVQRERPDVLVLNVSADAPSPFAPLVRIRAQHPALPVIVTSASDGAALVIDTARYGGLEFHPKPLRLERVLDVIDRAVAAGPRALPATVGMLAIEPHRDELIGRSAEMLAVYQDIGRVAATEAAVLLTGEPGTGKKHVARAIHRHGSRSAYPLWVVHCATSPETQFARLFGRDDIAHGTLVLDGVGRLPRPAQLELLEFLEGRFDGIGQCGDVRIVATCEQDLGAAVRQGAFDAALLHHLTAFTITLPPLRQRLDDLPPLIDHFLAIGSARLRIAWAPPSPSTLALLRAHSWPQNLRELERVCQRLLILGRDGGLSDDEVRRVLGGDDRGHSSATVDDLRAWIARYLATHAGNGAFEAIMRRTEGLLIAEALRICRGNRTRAAELLGTSRPTLHAKMNRHGLHEEPALALRHHVDGPSS